MASIDLDNISLDYPIRQGGLISRLRRRQDVSVEPDPRFLTNKRGVPVAFRALQDISLSLREGDRLGIIGRNGSGKSTLLRLLGGVVSPAAGTISITGSVQAMFDLQMGLRPTATGLQNIRSIGLMRGFTSRQIKEMTPDIIDFSGLGDFIHMPVKTYSSGMRTRLLFSSITALNPEILLLDEWFGTADKEFNDQASDRMKAIVERSGILMLASHSVPLLSKHCDQGLWLHDGKVRAFGPIDQVLGEFKAGRKTSDSPHDEADAAATQTASSHDHDDHG